MGGKCRATGAPTGSRGNRHTFGPCGSTTLRRPTESEERKGFSDSFLSELFFRLSPHPVSDLSFPQTSSSYLRPSTGPPMFSGLSRELLLYFSPRFTTFHHASLRFTAFHCFSRLLLLESLKKTVKSL